MDAVRRQARDDADSDEEDYLRPPGELANVSSTPLSVADVLNKVPPFQLGEQIIAEAQRLPGVSSAALYVVDLDGASMQRLAGAAHLPGSDHRAAGRRARDPARGRRGHPRGLRRAAARRDRGSASAAQPRDRVLLAVGTASDQLRDLASEAAIALSIAPAYTDYIDTVRRTRPTSPAAEIQQNLLPPRIARVGGATLAGNVLPGYEIGGDWFDYTENPQGTWLGIADSAGIGPVRRRHRRRDPRSVSVHPPRLRPTPPKACSPCTGPPGARRRTRDLLGHDRTLERARLDLPLGDRRRSAPHPRHRQTASSSPSTAS